MSKNEDETTKEKKKPMTDEERAALAKKLDDELDEFIAGLEKRRYTEGWPEDKWEEEMEKHPFFMSKLPEDGSLPPLLEGIQQLKYDENENTPLELATSYKEDGNFNFKHGNYRMAILSYTEGLRQKCDDVDIRSQLYNNRAAANFRLHNFRSSLTDCMAALKIKPDYPKAKLKAAECCAKLNKHKDAIQYCDEILENSPENKTVLELRAQSVSNQKTAEQARRKQELEQKKLNAELSAIVKALEKRKINIENGKDLIYSLETSIKKPYLLDGKLVWSVVFFYPEYFESDFLENFHEKSTFLDELKEVFAEPPKWDPVREYCPKDLALYFEGSDGNILHPVDINKTLGSVIRSKWFVLKDWIITFFVVVKGSRTENELFQKYAMVRGPEYPKVKVHPDVDNTEELICSQSISFN